VHEKYARNRRRTLLPTRILNVQNYNSQSDLVCLEDGANRRDRYVALSHCGVARSHPLPPRKILNPENAALKCRRRQPHFRMQDLIPRAYNGQGVLPNKNILYTNWYSMICRYSGCSVTLESDRFPALSGIHRRQISCGSVTSLTDSFGALSVESAGLRNGAHLRGHRLP
jgi:hypothetical protein